MLIEAVASRRLQHLTACYTTHSTQLNLLPEVAPTVYQCTDSSLLSFFTPTTLRVLCGSCCGHVWCSSVPPVIPYRDSTLTKLLYEGLKGNGRVLMMACCSPSKVTPPPPPPACVMYVVLKLTCETKYANHCLLHLPSLCCSAVVLLILGILCALSVFGLHLLT